MGNEMPKRPLWFSKPLSSLISSGMNVEIPKGFGQIDYEGELALVINKRCKNVTLEEAQNFIFGVLPALDITARELQKNDGQWTRAKGFDTFCPIGPIIAPWNQNWKKAEIRTRKNGIVVQEDSLSSLAFDFETLISDISKCMTLERGDLILTGTPAGVGPIKSGDNLQVELNGPVRLELSVNCS
jgi:2-keto-4-pentenoate hydratase/2-oxohepta-3-ene-1,7-dioic acid hydratase in catechol pathway